MRSFKVHIRGFQNDGLFRWGHSLCLLSTERVGDPFEPVCLEDLKREYDVMSKLKLLIFFAKMAKGKHIAKHSCFFPLIYWGSYDDFCNGGEAEIQLHEN